MRPSVGDRGGQSYQGVFERSSVPMLLVDDERRIVDLNDAFCGLTGLTRDEAVSIRIDDLMPVGALARQTTFTRPDGAVRDIEIEATAHVTPGRHLGIIRDVTERKELERQAHDAQRLESASRLAGAIAHDFNNLLTVISGYSELLVGDLADERLGRHAAEIERAAARAAALTNQLLAFSRRQVLQPVPLDLNDVVAELERALQTLLAPAVDLVIRLDLRLGEVAADRAQIERVLLDLSENARTSMRTGGTLTIATRNVERPDGTFAEVRLTDTGGGLTDEEQRKLFDPFAGREAGLSLGLATVLAIVEQSGGMIEVDSAPGAGTTFSVLLPLRDPGHATVSLFDV